MQIAHATTAAITPPWRRQQRLRATGILAIAYASIIVAMASLPARAAVPAPTPAEEQVTSRPPPGGRAGAPEVPRLSRETAMRVGDGATSMQSLGLEAQDDGTWLYRDPSGHFTATVQPDGSVLFADRWRRPSASDAQNGKCCGGGLGAIHGLSMTMTGPLEWIVLAQGKDLFAGAKSRLLNDTRELRTALAIDWHLDLLQRRFAQLEPELLQIWHDASLPIAKRRELLFERWDECDERFHTDASQAPEEARGRIDAARLRIAEQARERISAFVRRHAARGSADAFSAAELQALNQRRISREPFDPYAPRGKSVPQP